MRYLLAIDQGTTGSTIMLFGDDGRLAARRYREVTQYFPKPGWVEHDPMEIWQGVAELLAEMAAEYQLTRDNLSGIGITNQRETLVMWDRLTGRPLHRAIVWQCLRTADICRQLKSDGVEDMVRSKTGLLLDPYFSGTKLKWLLDELDAKEKVRERAAKGEIACGTVDAWLVWNLTGGAVHATDVSNASRTLLFNIDDLTWDDELLELFGAPREILPQVRPSSGNFGETYGVSDFPSGIPIGGCAGDQQAALFGQACFKPGMVKNTYGTGAFLLMNTGTKRRNAGKGLLSTVAWALEDLSEPIYAVEGSIFVAGAAIQWLRDSLGVIESAPQTEELANSIRDNGGVFFVPAFVGLGAPQWDPYARGTILGLTQGTTKAHLARAALEAIAYQSRDVIDAIAAASGMSLQGMRVDGGASVNDFLVQFQADVTGVAVDRPKQTETTAVGAAYLAGLSVGLWKDLDELAQLWEPDRRFEPQMSAEERTRLYGRWQEAVERSRGWAEERPT